MLGCATALGAIVTAHAQTEVPVNWELIPQGREPGDVFRLLLVTSTTRGARSSGISVYDAHVQDAVAATGHPQIRQYASQFKVLGSTEGLDARVHAEMTGTGVPIYWLNGARAANDNDDLFDASLWSGLARYETGATIGSCCRVVWTGSTSSGDAHWSQYFGAGAVMTGRADGNESRLEDEWSHAGNKHSVYGISSEFRVARREGRVAVKVRISSTPPYHTDDRIRITVQFDGRVHVATTGGTPAMGLDVGGVMRTAAYASGSGTDTLEFAYRVSADDYDDDGIMVETIALNGGSIHAVGHPSDEADLGDTRRSNTRFHIVNARPYIRSVTVSSRPRAAVKTYGFDETIAFRVRFNEAVVVQGAPHFEFALGDATKVARLAEGRGTPNLVFHYVVQEGDLDENGVRIGDHTTTLKFEEGEEIRSARSGRDAALEHRAPGTQGGHRVDAQASPGDVSLDARLSSLRISNTALSPSFASQTTRYSALVRNGVSQVTVTLARKDAGAKYRISPGDASFTDAGHQVPLNVGTTTITVDVTAEDRVTKRTYTVNITRAQAVTPVASDSDVWSATVTTSLSGDVSPGYREDAVFDPRFPDKPEEEGAITDKNFRFRNQTYTILEMVDTSAGFDLWMRPGSNELEALTLHIGDTRLQLSGARSFISSLWRWYGNQADVGWERDTDYAVKITADLPTITDIAFTSTPAFAGTYGTHETIELTATFDEPVLVNGTPEAVLMIGGNEVTAPYVSGSGTNKLVFQYKVVASDKESAGVEIPADTLAKDNDASLAQLRGGATIRSLADNDHADVTSPAIFAGSDHKVDGGQMPLPTIPLNLTATPDGATRIDLAWSAPNTPSDRPVTGYHIEVSDDGGRTWTDLEADSASDARTYAHTGLSGGDVRHYRVSGINSIGEGPSSDVAQAQTIAAIWIAAQKSPVTEGSNAPFVLRVAGATPADVTVPVTITQDGEVIDDTHGYTVPSEVVIARNSAGGRFVVRTQQDATPEHTGAITATIGPGPGFVVRAPAEAVVEVEDDDRPMIGVADAEANEGDALEFTVTLDPDSDRSHTVEYTAESGPNDTADAADYTAGSGTVSFAAGVTTQVVRVPTTQDGTDEANTETMTLTLKNPSFAFLADASATGTIRDTDGTTVITIEAGTSPITEGTDAAFRLNRAGATTAALDVNVAVEETGSTTVGNATTTATFAAGAAHATLTVATEDDGTPENDSVVTATVTASSGETYAVGTPASAQVTVADDEPALRIAGATAEEGDAMVFEVTLSPTSTNEVTVDFATRDGSATAGADFVASAATLTLAPGVGSASITIATIEDETHERSESFDVVLTNPGNASIDTGGDIGHGSIDDDDTLSAMPVPAPARTVAASWDLTPDDLGPGDAFRLLIVTSTVHSSTPTNIAVYDSNVQNAVATKGHHAIREYSDSFRVLGSTRRVDADTHTGLTGTGVPIYWLDGDRAADDYGDFFGTMLWGGEGRFQSGRRTGERRVFTGSTDSGKSHADHYLGSNGFAMTGYTQGSRSRLSHGPVVAQPLTDFSLYGMSPEFRIRMPAGPSTTDAWIASTGPYHTDDVIEIRVRFERAVEVDTTGGTPRIEIVMEEVTREAQYTSGSGTRTLVFEYRVVATDHDADGVAIGSLARNGGEIHAAGDPLEEADLGDTRRGENGTERVNIAPYIRNVAVTSKPQATTDTYGVEETIEFEVTFSEPVQLTGAPHFEFDLGGETRIAPLAHGADTDTLAFQYIVQTDDLDQDGIWFGDGSDTFKLEPGERIRSVRTARDAVLDHARGGLKRAHKVDPTATPGDLSSDASLSGLDLGVSLRPEFATDTTRYTALVRNGIAQLTVKATRNDSEATLAISPRDASGGSTGHQVDLAVGDTTIVIRVTAENGVTTRTYKVVVTRAQEVSPTAPNTEIWSATVTTGECCRGYTQTYGSITDRDFNYGGRTYIINKLYDSVDWLRLELNRTHDDLKALTLFLDSKRYRFSEAGFPPGDKKVNWTSPDPNLDFATDYALRITVDAPTITGIEFTSTPKLGTTYGKDEIIELTATFDEPVAVTGTPQAVIMVSTKEAPAPYVRGAGTNKLRFQYRVVASDRESEGVWAPADTLAKDGDASLTEVRGGGTIRSLADNDHADLRSAAVSKDPDHKVDGAQANILGVPVSLSATPDGATRIDLTWTAPFAPSHRPITGYHIEVSEDAGRTWTDLEADTGNDAGTYAHTGLSGGDTRHYRVSAINSLGEGPSSDVAWARTSLGVWVGARRNRIAEGEDAQYVLHLAGTTSEEITVTVAVTEDGELIDDTDGYAAPTEVIIPANRTGAPFAVQTKQDETHEPTGTIKATVEPGTGYTVGDPSEAVVEVEDDDRPLLSVDDAQADEGGELEFTVTLSSASSRDQTFEYITGLNSYDTAESADYEHISDTAEIPAGATTTTVKVKTLQDASDEDDETMTLALRNPSFAILADGVGTGTIKDDDDPPTVSVAEGVGAEGRTVDFEVTLNRTSERRVSASWTPSIETGDTAEPGDYAAPGGSVTIEPGETMARARVVALMDTDIDHETFTLTLSNPVNATIGTATAKGTIIDAEARVTLSIEENLGAETERDARDIGEPVTDSQGTGTGGYRLSGTDAGKFDIDPENGQVRTRIGENYDHETQASHDLVVEIGDGTTMVVRAVIIEVTNRTDEQPLAPETPTVLGASATSVFTSWPKPHNTGRPKIEGYDVRYRAGTSGPWTDGPQDLTDRGTRIIGLAEDSAYQVQVRAQNGDGDGPWSSAGSARTYAADTQGHVLLDTTLKVAELRRDGRITGCANSNNATDCERRLGQNTFVSTDTQGTAKDFGITDLQLTRAEWSERLQRDPGKTLAIAFAGVRELRDYEVENLVLVLDGTSFRFLHADAGGYHVRAWWNSGLDWQGGDFVQVRILDGRIAGQHAEPLTASFEDVPQSHDGANAFKVRIAFSEEVDIEPEAMRDHALTVTAATVTGAVEVDGAGGTWDITIQPSGDEEITVHVPLPEDCADAGALCTSDGRKLTTSLLGAIPGMPAPHVTGASVTSDPGTNGTWDEGETVTAEIRFSEAVQVIGPPNAAPTLALTLDGARLEAPYTSGSGTDAFTFSYEVTADHDGARKARVVANGLSLNGIVIGNDRGQEADVGFAVPPWVSAVALVADASGDRRWTSGETVEVLLTFSEAVTVDVSQDTPMAEITAQGTTTTLDYAAGSESAELVFSKTLTASDPELTEVAVTANSVTLAGAKIASLASGLAAELEHDATEATTPPDTQPEELTASFVDVPPEHDGSSTFTLGLQFSEAPRVSFRTLRDEALSASAGTVKRARRVVKGENDRWEIHVAPAGSGPVTVMLEANAPCGTNGAICTADGRALANAPTATIGRLPGLSVADAVVHEEPGARLEFTITLSHAVSGTVTVDAATADGTAIAGQDYRAKSRTTTFAPGETTKALWVKVIDDTHDEGSETMTVTLSNPSGAYIIDGEATGTIHNSDTMPRAWLARFGRTVGEQVLDALEARMRARHAPGAALTFAGHPVGGQADFEALEAHHGARRLETFVEWMDGDDTDLRRTPESRELTAREMLTGSAFSWTRGSDEERSATLWGRGAVTRFDGREGDLTLDGEVASALLGADFTRDRGTAGLVVAHSLGEGGYRSPSGDGEVESTLTGLYPWGRYAASKRLSLWGVAGYGAGTLTLIPEGQAAIETDMDLMMAAVGGRGVLAEAPAEGGLELSITSDATVVRTTSEEVRGSRGSLAASEGDVTRLRLGLEGTWRGLGTASGGTFVPTLEIGARHDGGDAETGFGADIGGRLVWADPALGIRAELAARGLLTHEDGSLSERGFAGSLAWDPSPDTDRGPKLTLRQALGAEASGGMDALLRPDTARALAAANDDGPDRRALEARLGYGFAVFGGGWTGIPEVGFGLTETGRETLLGGRLLEARGAGLVFSLDVEGVRNEKLDADAEPEHRVGLGFGWELLSSRRENLRLRLEALRVLPANDDPENRVGVSVTARW